MNDVGANILRDSVATESTLLLGDCREVLKTLAENSVDSVVTDPPYELGFMGKKWDSTGIAYDTGMWAEVLRVLKPGGHLLSFGGTRTYHRMVCAIEDAGFEIRDSMHWVYGCLSDDTEILTPDGWVQYRKAMVGSLVIGYNIDMDTFEPMPVEEVYVYDYDDTAYRLYSDRTDQLVSRNHRCLVERCGNYVFEFAEEAARERQARVPILEDVQGLLDALPLSHEGAGDPEPDMRTSLCQPIHKQKQDREDRTTGGHLPDRTLCSPMRAMRKGLRYGTQVLQSAATLLLQQMLGSAAGRRSGVFTAHATSGRIGQEGLDGRESHILQGQDERRCESSVEGWRDHLSQAWELCRCAVRPLSRSLPRYGAQGRLCHGASPTSGPCAWSLSITARDGTPQEPHSQRQPSEEPATVLQQQGPQAVRASRFSRTDLVTVEPVPYTGKVWCVRVRSGAFVARRNGMAFITGNSGFPKSLDVSKAVDSVGGKHLGWFGEWLSVEREKHGWSRADMADHVRSRTGGLTGTVWDWEHGTRLPTVKQFNTLCEAFNLPFTTLEDLERTYVGEGHAGLGKGSPAHDGGYKPSYKLTAPATDAAKQWDGWGTALKPGHEPICLARKPLIGTVAANVLAFGTGGLNIDGCRIKGAKPATGRGAGGQNGRYGPIGAQGRIEDDGMGRWPANIMFSHSASCLPDECADDCPVAELDRQSGISKSAGGINGGTLGNSIYGKFANDPDKAHANAGGLGDSGGASRFFYVAKPSRKERDAGLDDFANHSGGELTLRKEGTAGLDNPRAGAGRTSGGRCTHPTVKPVKLMRYLCKLVTPPSGTILDCFMGSGTTGAAALSEGFKFIGIEMSEEYLDIAGARIKALGVRKQELFEGIGHVVQPMLRAKLGDRINGSSTTELHGMHEQAHLRQAGERSRTI